MNPITLDNPWIPKHNIKKNTILFPKNFKNDLAIDEN